MTARTRTVVVSTGRKAAMRGLVETGAFAGRAHAHGLAFFPVRGPGTALASTAAHMRSAEASRLGERASNFGSPMRRADRNTDSGTTAFKMTFVRNRRHQREPQRIGE